LELLLLGTGDTSPPLEYLTVAPYMDTYVGKLTQLYCAKSASVKGGSIREHGSVLYLGMAKEVSNLA